MKSKNVSLAVEIYPREGTETPPTSAELLSYALKFIPVRGRKQPQPIQTLPTTVEIYPREGTETLFGTFPLISKKVEIYPREGTETEFDIYMA